MPHINLLAPRPRIQSQRARGVTCNVCGNDEWLAVEYISGSHAKRAMGLAAARAAGIKIQTRFRCAPCNRKGRKGYKYKLSDEQKARRRQYRKRPYVRATERKWALEWRRSHPAEYLLQDARRRARKLGRDFDITIEDIVIPAVCPLLGIPIVPGTGRTHDGSPSLDRKDSAKGYTRGNVWVISWRANVIKRDATLEELRLIVAGLEKRDA